MPAVTQVLPTDLDQQGIADKDDLATAIQVVFIQLAAAADMLMQLESTDPDKLAQLLDDAE
jgi:hypothetical protein